MAKMFLWGQASRHSYTGRGGFTMEHRLKDELDRASPASVLPIVNHHLEVVDNKKELALRKVGAWPRFALHLGPEHI
jgi:hypothetical protein